MLVLISIVAVPAISIRPGSDPISHCAKTLLGGHVTTTFRVAVHKM